MSEEPIAIAKSMIKTEIIVPDFSIVAMLVKMFPELGEDVNLTNVESTYTTGRQCKFTVEHCVQEPKPAGPILLEAVNGDAEEAESV